LTISGVIEDSSAGGDACPLAARADAATAEAIEASRIRVLTFMMTWLQFTSGASAAQSPGAWFLPNGAITTTTS
jgi:hypothetical protein